MSYEGHEGHLHIELHGEHSGHGEHHYEGQQSMHGVQGGQSAVVPEPPRYEAYCVRCKQKREIIHPQHTIGKRNKPLVKGKCANCGAGMTKFLKKNEAHAPA